MTLKKENNFFKVLLERSLPPLALILILAGFNFALYSRLSPTRLETSHNLPFWDIFEHQNLSWSILSGAFKLENGWLGTQSSTRALIQVPLELKAQQAYRIKTTLQLLKTSSMAGVLFGGQRQGALRTQELRFINGSLMAGYDDAAGEFQIVQENAVSTLKPEHRLEIRVGATTYSVLFDSEIIMEDLSLHYQGGLMALTAQGSARFDDLLVSADTSLQNQNVMSITPESLGWHRLSGIWQLHQKTKTLEQRQNNQFDRSILFDKQAFDITNVQLGFKHLKGVGAGLLFNVPKAGQISGAQLVRYSDDGNSVFWGYYNAKGVFQGQGSRKVSQPMTRSHNLEIQIKAKTYAVSLDGHELARNIVLISPSGFMGLTASQCVARFETLSIKTTSETQQLLPVKVKP